MACMTILGVAVVVAAVVVANADAHTAPPQWALGGDFGKASRTRRSADHDPDAPLSSPLHMSFPLDHFSRETPTFYGRYYIMDDYYHAGNPCFFSMGGEAPNNGIGSDYVVYLAKQHSALVVSIEHRFYGDSVPNNDMSVNNLQYLTSEQALADAAYLIKQLNEGGRYKCSKWFAFGGSYSGALSAWFRLKYPDVIVGSLSSSGVVNAILNFTAFDEHVQTAIGPDCTKDVQRVSQAFADAMKKPGASQAAKQLFGARPDLPDGDFAYMLADSAAMADQYNNKDKLCATLKDMSNEKDDNVVMKTFADFTNSFWGADFGSSCFYDSECVRSDPKRWQPTARSWWWQKCHELAYWQNAPKTNSLRLPLITYEYHKTRCEYMFAKNVFPDTAATNNYYGGNQPNGTNIYFSDFSDDPWMQASVLKELSADLPYQLVTCDGCGHCFDLHYPSDSDPQVLKDSRTRFETYLAKWLK